MQKLRLYFIQAATSFCVAAFLFTSCQKENELVSNQHYLAIHEIAGLKSITDTLLPQIQADTSLYPFFAQQGIFVNENTTLNYQNNLIDFLCQQLNGPCKYKAGNLFFLDETAKLYISTYMSTALDKNLVVGETKDAVLLHFKDFLSLQNVAQ